MDQLLRKAQPQPNSEKPHSRRRSLTEELVACVDWSLQGEGSPERPRVTFATSELDDTLTDKSGPAPSIAEAVRRAAEQHDAPSAPGPERIPAPVTEPLEKKLRAPRQSRFSIDLARALTSIIR